MIDGSGFPALGKISAIGYRDLMGEKLQHRRRKTPEAKLKEALAVTEEVSSESCENYCTESVDEASSSTTSSSSSPRTTALKDWNGVRELAGNKGLTTASGFLCCLVAHKSVHCLAPTSNMDR